MDEKKMDGQQILWMALASSRNMDAFLGILIQIVRYIIILTIQLGWMVRDLTLMYACGT